jgi:hypothetical protein
MASSKVVWARFSVSFTAELKDSVEFTLVSVKFEESAG